MKTFLARWLVALAFVAFFALEVSNRVLHEPAYGSLIGRAVMRENGRPLPDADVTLTQNISEPETGAYIAPKTYYATSGDDGRFAFYGVPVGKYLLSVDGAAHSFDNKETTIVEGNPSDVSIRTPPEKPFLRSSDSSITLRPHRPGHVSFIGFPIKPNASITIYRADVQAMIVAGDYNDLNGLAGGNTWSLFEPKFFHEELRFKPELGRGDVEGVFHYRCNLPPQSAGLYYVVFRDGGQSTALTWNETDLGLIVRTDDASALAYTADLESGIAAQKCKVAVLTSRTTLSALTSNSGTATFPLQTSSSSLVTCALEGGSVALCSTYGNGDSTSPKSTIAWVFDRPLYKPGDTVGFKGIVRSFSGSDFALPPAGSQADVTVRYEGSGPALERLTIPVSHHGTFAGSFAINPESPPGAYDFQARVGSITGGSSAVVAAYQKPNATLSIQPVKGHYLFGEIAQFKISCKYYYGAPVPGAKLSAFVTRSQEYNEGPLSTPYDDDGSDDQTNVGHEEGADLPEIDAVTDSNGEAVISFPTALPNGQKPDADYQYSVDVTADTGANTSAESTGAVVVRRGDIGVESEIDPDIAGPKDVITATVATFDPDNPNKALPNEKVQVQVGREDWQGDTEKFQLLSTYSAVTNAKGLAEVTFQAPNYASIAIRSTAWDAAERAVTDEQSLWVTGGEGNLPPISGLTASLDRKRYQPGDIAKLMIRTTHYGGDVLLNIEGGHINSTQVVRLSGPVTVVSLPIQSTYHPNVFIALSAIRGGRLAQAAVPLYVGWNQRKLQVKLTAKSGVVEPGGAQQISVRTTDGAGKPVAADVSVAVDNEALFALVPPLAPITDSFYAHRDDSVQTASSVTQAYLDGGDKGAINIKLRLKFKDLAYWNPDVITDSKGLASVSFHVPDNIGQWRVTAIGATDSTAVGESHDKFIARKPFMVQLVTPPSLVKGDRRNVEVLVSNDTGTSGTASVKLAAEGSAISIANGGDFNVPLASGSRTTLDATLKANATGPVKVDAAGSFAVEQSTSPTATDGESRSIDVRPFGIESNHHWAGEFTGTESFIARRKANSDSMTGRLRIEIIPGLESALVQAVDPLIDDPFSCTEQTVDRFVPALTMLQDLPLVAQQRPDLVARVHAATVGALIRLWRLQGDQAWGWWTYDQPDSALSAMALDGIYRAKQLGLNVSSFRIKTALHWALSSSTYPLQPDSDPVSRLYLAWDAARLGYPNVALDLLHSLRRSFLGPREVAYAALTYYALGTKYRSQRDTCLNLLRRMALIDGPIAHWMDDAYDEGYRTTAVVMMALQTANPNDSLLPKVVAYFMRNRAEGMWGSTWSTGAAVIALSDYAKLHPSPNGSAPIEIDVNGTPFRTLAATGLPGKASLLVEDVPISDLRIGRNQITLKAGGTMWYEANLRQYVQQQTLPAMPSDVLSVSRSYYLLKPVSAKDGSWSIQPSNHPITKAKVGDLVQCSVTLKASRLLDFLKIDCPTPANFSADWQGDIDPSDWTHWFSDELVFADHVTFFARRLSDTTEQITYTLHADRPGICAALPVVTADMYDDRIHASSSGASLEVVP